jgi:hypothetical protein
VFSGNVSADALRVLIELRISAMRGAADVHMSSWVT